MITITVSGEVNSGKTKIGLAIMQALVDAGITNITLDDQNSGDSVSERIDLTKIKDKISQSGTLIKVVQVRKSYPDSTYPENNEVVSVVEKYLPDNLKA